MSVANWGWRSAAGTTGAGPLATFGLVPAATLPPEPPAVVVQMGGSGMALSGTAITTLVSGEPFTLVVQVPNAIAASMTSAVLFIQALATDPANVHVLLVAATIGRPGPATDLAFSLSATQTLLLKAPSYLYSVQITTATDVFMPSWNGLITPH